MLKLYVHIIRLYDGFDGKQVGNVLKCVIVYNRYTLHFFCVFGKWPKWNISFNGMMIVSDVAFGEIFAWQIMVKSIKVHALVSVGWQKRLTSDWD